MIFITLRRISLETIKQRHTLHYFVVDGANLFLISGTVVWISYCETLNLKNEMSCPPRLVVCIIRLHDWTGFPPTTAEQERLACPIKIIPSSAANSFISAVRVWPRLL